MSYLHDLVSPELVRLAGSLTRLILRILNDFLKCSEVA